jgi:DNA polymerase I-like protein with 3'-5' exonuclease and polymerase domains
MLLAIDIETAPAEGFENYEDAALDFHRAKITQIAWASEDGRSGAFQTVEGLNYLLRERRNWELVGHNFKFDLKSLIYHGAALPFDSYHNDTMLQAVASYDKIPDEWLAEYNTHRVKKNMELKAEVHREAGQYSLKSLAPYLLGVEPFWEAADHNNSEYAIKDAQYTLQLFQYQQKILRFQGTEKFYAEKLMPWARMILEAEYTGITLDTSRMADKWQDAQLKAKEAENKLIELWQEPFLHYEKLQRQKVDKQYEGMKAAAILKAKTDKTKKNAELRYEALKDKALEKVEPFNMASHAQLMWLLRDYYGLDVDTFEGDQSTGKSVLKRLAAEGRKDIEAFLDFRRYTKLHTAFFPSYNSMQWAGKLHCGFNLSGTRTGRLSSSKPNLQQVPGDLHDLFTVQKGMKVINDDLSNVEPNLIAYLTECPKLCDILINGGNFHDFNTRIFFDLDDSVSPADIKSSYATHRKVAKEVGLLLLYGGGHKRIRESMQKQGFQKSESECRAIYQKFRQEYKVIFDYKKDLDRRLENGEPVTNLMGRKFKIPNKEDVYMKGFNTLIQGSASDMLLEGGRRAATELKQKGINARPLLFVHDELVMEAEAERAQEAREILLKNLLGFKLQTQYGEIKLKSEGGIFDRWHK